jgi:hypothetical protein
VLDLLIVVVDDVDVPLLVVCKVDVVIVTVSVLVPNTQLPLKNGLTAVATIVPEYPALQVQPATTFAPLEKLGQATAVQFPV